MGAENVQRKKVDYWLLRAWDENSHELFGVWWGEELF